ncbi:type II toxin-antitoxin system RelE/ParE family toxin [Treponema sp. HNW]|uniref:type II toxin-antitoxin system RelE family toxin n=1 Tax=Treponema sp. HNW TaxID=3116654 RepID=UPI003D095F04
MKVIFSEEAEKQITKLDKPIQKRIFDYMTDVANLSNPRDRGKMLVGNLFGYWRYRVGDYRVLCKIQDQELVVYVVEVGHRRAVYDNK